MDFSSEPHKTRPPEVVLEKSVLEICSKFAGKQPYRSAISIKLQSDFSETAFQYGCYSRIQLYIFRTLCPKNTSGGHFRPQSFSYPKQSCFRKRFATCSYTVQVCNFIKKNCFCMTQNIDCFKLLCLVVNLSLT